MPPPQTEVLITVAGVETRRFVLEPGDYIIGRNSDCPIRVDADLVSRQHAKLILNYDHALIEDLGSSNGTQVNGQPIAKDERTRLWPNQKIQVGTATIELRRLQGDAPSDMSLAPAQRAVRDMLPAELLREKKYDIGAVVARGGMGAILDAKEAAIKRRVAMKVMLDTNDADAIARFVAEAQVTGQLEHPNIVPVYELGVDENGQPFYTMKMVRGITLKKVLELLAKGVAETVQKFPLSALLTVFQKVCDAIAFAHSKGVIHRDLKPENLMLGDFGSVLVMDWGLAKVLDPNRAAASVAPGQDLRSIVHTAPGDANTGSMTLVDTIMGTPQYMAPEQARGEIETLDARTDIYALGAILFHILFLRPPVSGSDAMQVVGKVARGEVEWWNATSGRVSDAGCQTAAEEKRARRSRSTVPDSLLAVCRKALALDPATRYPHVEDLQADILAYQNGFATSAEKAGAWKQFALLIKRHKAASIGLAAVLLVGSVFGTKAMLEGRRAERGEALAKIEATRAKAETKRANAALADLKASAPALLQLAESEAGFQRFDSALAKLDAALALDPSIEDAYWQRAWCLLGQEKWNAAVAAMRSAADRNPARNDRISIVPTVERIATALGAGGEASKPDALALVAHLEQVGAPGAATRLGVQLKTGRNELDRICKKRIAEWLGEKTKWQAGIGESGLLWANLQGLPINTLAPLRGLPLEAIWISDTLVSDIAPLQGMLLRTVRAVRVPIADLRPLAGMPIESIDMRGSLVRDLTPLRGMPLRELTLSNSTDVEDLSPLDDLPLKILRVGYTSVRDLSPTRGMKLTHLTIEVTEVDDLSTLRGMPLLVLWMKRTKVHDLAPLRGAPLVELQIQQNDRFQDLTPLLDLPKLRKLRVSKLGKRLEPLRAHPSLQQIAYEEEPYRPVAEFWADFDVWKNLQDTREKNLAQVAAALPALGIAKGKATIVEPWGVRVGLDKLPVADVSGLRPLPIDSLSLFETKVAGLAPLRGMRLKELRFAKTAVKDVSPLLDMPILEAALLTAGATNLGVLRQHPTLKWLGWEGDWDAAANRPKLTTAEFWARYDAQQAAQKK